MCLLKGHSLPINHTLRTSHTNLLYIERSASTLLGQALQIIYTTFALLCCLELTKSIAKGTEATGQTFLVLQHKKLASDAVPQLTLTILDTSGTNLKFDNLSATTYKKCLMQAVLGVSGNVMGQLCLITEAFDRDGKEGRLYALELSERMYTKYEVTLVGFWTLKFDELSDTDTQQAVPKRIHTLAFTGKKWIASANRVAY